MSKSHVETEFRNLMYKVDVQNKCIKVMWQLYGQPVI